MGEIKNRHDLVKAQSMFVAKGNDLIQRSRYSLNNLEQKALLYLISKIKPQDAPMTTYEFNIHDFCKVCDLDITGGGKYYDYVKNILIKLRSTPIIIDNKRNETVITGWIVRAKIKANGNFEIMFDEELTPYLFGLQTFYTRYALEWVLDMKSKYGIRLYELLASYLNIKTVQRYDIDELRHLLGCENYSAYSDFRKYVLEPAVKDINDASNIYATYKVIKNGRRVSEIEFTVDYRNAGFY